MRTTVTLADALARGRVTLAETNPFQSEPISTARDERDAEILARTGPDPELTGLAAHAAGLPFATPLAACNAVSERDWLPHQRSTS